MNHTLAFSKKLAILIVPVIIVGLIIGVSKSTLFQAHPDTLAIGITVDLLLVLPLIYFLLIRKSKIPKTTVIPMLIIGIVIGTIILPIENQFYLNQFKFWVLPVIEFSILGFIIYKVRTGIKRYKNSDAKSKDFYSNLKTVCAEILPKKAVMPFVTEISMFYYALFSWRKIDLEPNQFTYHKSTGSQALFGAFIFVIGIETFALHLLFVGWSPVFAWILTLLSIYTALQGFSIAKSLSKRPIVIAKDHLKLRYGILNEVDIPFAQIALIEYSKKEIEKKKDTSRLSPIGQMEGHNVILTVKSTLQLIGIYGLKKEFSKIVFTVDQVDEFKLKLSKALIEMNGKGESIC